MTIGAGVVAVLLAIACGVAAFTWLPGTAWWWDVALGVAGLGLGALLAEAARAVETVAQARRFARGGGKAASITGFIRNNALPQSYELVRRAPQPDAIDRADDKLKLIVPCALLAFGLGPAILALHYWSWRPPGELQQLARAGAVLAPAWFGSALVGLAWKSWLHDRRAESLRILLGARHDAVRRVMQEFQFAQLKRQVTAASTPADVARVLFTSLIDALPALRRAQIEAFATTWGGGDPGPIIAAPRHLMEARLERHLDRLARQSGFERFAMEYEGRWRCAFITAHYDTTSAARRSAFVLVWRGEDEVAAVSSEAFAEGARAPGGPGGGPGQGARAG